MVRQRQFASRRGTSEGILAEPGCGRTNPFGGYSCDPLQSNGWAIMKSDAGSAEQGVDPLSMIQSFGRRIGRFVRYQYGRLRPRGAVRWYRDSDEIEKFRHILEAINYLRVAQMPLTLFEFGCHSGRTFSAALQAAAYLGVPLDAYAFDSFRGLPETNEDEDGIFRTGSFATTREEFERIVARRTGVKLRPAQVVEGYYEDSLTSELAARLPSRVGMIHVDVDLYSSTRTVLTFAQPFLVNGTVLLFDDWFCFSPGRAMGERRAVQEFLAEHPRVRLIEWKAYSTFGMSFFVVLDDDPAV
jgi:O-methyltransferase